MSDHPIVHVEISANDRKESAEFYSAVFGWNVQHFDDMHYTTFTTGDGEVGGGLNPVGENTEAGTVTVYIGADDIEGKLADIVAHGGEVVMPMMEIPQTGWFAMFKDPTGNVLALYKAMEMEGE